MKQEEITRTILEEVKVDVLTDSVRERASELLGYRMSVSHLSTEVAGDLRTAIQKLGIEVLDQASVLKYQSERLASTVLAGGPTMSSTWRSDPGWHRSKLAEYKNPIPDFALERALQVKQECGAVEFLVEELNNDPFLIVYLPNGSYSVHEMYYIACWEEARFESTL